MVLSIVLMFIQIIVQVTFIFLKIILFQSYFYLGQGGPSGPSYPVFIPASPLIIAAGSSQLIQPQGAYYQVQWRRDGGQPLPSGVYQNGNGLQITDARPDHSGTYYCELYGADGLPTSIPYEIRVRAGDRPHPSGGKFIKKKSD